ncbi:MAG: chaperone NapD [Kangiellaceae bacterium]|nr:chaperone NapD [Kangiellaceae bacterium]
MNNNTAKRFNISNKNPNSCGGNKSESLETEYHVASFIAHAMANQMLDVQLAIKELEGAEVHAVSEQGKIVFTIEGSSQAGIGRKIDLLKYHTGLLNLAPVYHQFLSEKQTQKQVRP